MSNIQYIFGFPHLESLNDLSNKTRLSKYLLYHMTTNTDHFYKQVKMKKKNGDERILSCPSKKLKAVQAWILVNILEKIPIESVATAYIKGKNIKDNVTIHHENKFVLCLDIKNFFDKISSKWVYCLFHSLGYNKFMSILLTKLCTYKGYLPQGGVTSPCLSNILCKRLDRRILGYAGRRNIVYSRYADDLILSNNDPAILLKSLLFIKKIIQNEGFELKEEKTRVLRPGHRKKITGLVISDDNKIGIGRRKMRDIRAAIHHLETGRTDKWDDHEKLEAHIKGWLNFLKSIDEYSFNKLNLYWKNLIEKIPKKEVASVDEES